MFDEIKRTAVVALAAVWLGGSAMVPMPASLERFPSVASPVVERLEPGERFEKVFELAADRYLELAVEQLEGDVTLRLLGSSGETISTSRLPGRPSQEEIVAVVTPRAGTYVARIEVEDSATAPARFAMRTTAERRATRRDGRRAEGLRMFQEAMRLKQAETEASSQLAIESFELSAAVFEEARDAAWRGRALHETARVLERLGQMDLARERFSRATEVLRGVEAREPLAEALAAFGSLLGDLGETDEGMRLCGEALELSRRLGAEDLEAMSLNNIAAIQLQLGMAEEAAENVEEAVALRRKLGNREALATNLNNLGVVYRKLGRTEHALDSYNEALALELALGRRGEGVNTLYNNLGVLYRARGEARRAIGAYRQARELAERRGALDVAAAAAHNEGSLYRKLGEPQRARALLHEALALYRRLESPAEAWVLQALGGLEADQGDHQAALLFLEGARQRGAEFEDRTVQAYALSGIGRCRLELGELVAARGALEAARGIQREIGDRYGLSSTLRHLSIVAGREGELEEARTHADEALLLAEQIGDPGHAASARERRAAVLEKSGDLGAARRDLERSIATLESLRGDLVMPDLRATFFARSQARYVQLVNLIHRLSSESEGATGAAAEEAFEVSERARARSLAERIWESGERSGHEADPRLEGERRELLARLSTTQRALTRLLRKEQADPQAVEARRMEVAEVYRALQDIDRDLRLSDSRWDTLSYPDPVDVRAAQSLVGPEAALLSYLLGADESFLFVVTQDRLEMIRLPGERELAPLVEELRRLLEVPSRRSLGRFARVSRELYEILVAPAESAIAERERLVIVPDGALHYLPFETLLGGDVSSPDSSGLADAYLISRWAVSYAPSVSVLSSLRSRRPTVAEHEVGWVAFGDPTLPGTELAAPREVVTRGLAEQPSWRWRRLAGARAEVRQIEGLFPAGDAIVFLGDRAGEQELKSEAVVERARYLHFASHALVDSRTPDLSAVLLAPAVDGTQDGLLQAHEVLDFDLSAELVVLSGCETALGRQVRGEGLVGFTQAFLFAGARAVAVSLWPVEDESTGQLMVRFYGGLQDREHAVEALRQAKLEQLSNPATAHPYYWAPFVLLGAPS